MAETLNGEITFDWISKSQMERDENIIKVGSIPHPIIKEHYIQFIQAISKDKNCIYTKFLHPDENPCMKMPNDFHPKCAIEYCNIHGLFKGEYD